MDGVFLKVFLVDYKKVLAEGLTAVIEGAGIIALSEQ